MKPKKLLIIFIILSMTLTGFLRVSPVSANEMNPVPLTDSEVQSFENSSAEQTDLLAFQAGATGGNDPVIGIIVVGLFAAGILLFLVISAK
jgi:hypothetical protein